MGRLVTTFWVSPSTYPSTNCKHRSTTKKASIRRFSTMNARCVSVIADQLSRLYAVTNAASYGKRKMMMNSRSIMNPSQYITYHA